MYKKIKNGIIFILKINILLFLQIFQIDVKPTNFYVIVIIRFNQNQYKLILILKTYIKCKTILIIKNIYISLKSKVIIQYPQKVYHILTLLPVKNRYIKN